jgi:NAD(P)-dependent dehydrogenase (short-subunit alcohol dehydrogenase family)
MKSAFVTGSATGIGEALVVRLHREGWQVFAAYHASPPDRTRWFGKPNVVGLQCDVTQLEQVAAAAAAVRGQTGGGLDLLINNAGYLAKEGVIEAADMAEYRRAFDVNFWGPMQVIQAMMPLLRRSGGRVINTTSASVYMTTPMSSAYPTSKAALKAMTQHLRAELAPFGIEVTNLEPGGVDTAMIAIDQGAEQRQWETIPEPLRAQYRQHFRSGAAAIGDNLTSYTPDVFAAQVWRKVISARRWKPSYLIGPRVAFLPWMHRLLPAQQVQNIWQRMFRAA